MLEIILLCHISMILACQVCDHASALLGGYSPWLSNVNPCYYPKEGKTCRFILLGFEIWSLILILMFIFGRERERERASTSGRGAEIERETQNWKQAPGSELSAQSPTQGSNS